MISLSYPAQQRRSAWLLIMILLLQLITPNLTYGLTGGPSQPEVQSFEPIGTSEMVDVSSGSFTYNIPLLEVGGYPVNLAYHSGSTPDEEASVCGLGWNINPGVVNRNMRGLPDDFNGDFVEKEFNMKPNQTWGGSVGGKLELFGFAKNKGTGKFNLSSNMGVFYNNYKGVGFEFGITPGFSAGEKGSSTASFGLGLSANSQSGISISPSMNFSAKLKEVVKNGDKGNLTGGLSIGSTVNSRMGLSALTIGGKLGISGTGTMTVKNKDPQGNDISTSQRVDFQRSLFGTSSTFNFATPTYSPSATLPFRNLSFSSTIAVGLELTGIFPSGSTTGYYSEQRLAKDYLSSPAYGYLYAQNGTGNENSLMDFNREKDGPFTKYTKHLPPVVFTNDVYGATGQGIAGSYQLKRGDIGILADARVLTNGYGGSFGFEVGVGAPPPGFHGGGDLVLNMTNAKSGKWSKNNLALGALGFKGLAATPNYEPAYFKIAGEKSVETDPEFFTSNGGTEPVRVRLKNNGITNMNVPTEAKWETEGNVSYPMARPARNKRERRNQSISYLTAIEAKNFALETEIRNYSINGFNWAQPQYTKIDRVSATDPNNFRKAGHLSEITVLRQDGLRYIYGIPAYNTNQEEVSFSTKNKGNCSDGLVPIASGEDTKGNKSGIDNYFNKVIIPAYAHSYLLTAIVSQDYVDVKNDGPTPDDYGTYTKFNYSRVLDDYTWRIPYQAGQANFNEGLKSIDEDDKANYTSGTKEYWVIHSIISNTQVAEFTYETNNRTDAQSATSQKLPKLEKITLYSLPDRLANGANAFPIKTVWFQYDNSLCPGIPNGGTGGKLTLKALYFTTGISQKGKLSPYKFEYGQHGSVIVNPTYNLKAYNRWGTYQENKGNPGTDCYSDPSVGPLNTSDYPYIPQLDIVQANANAAAYNLTQINLPSGGIIKVEYEANDYAYTQDRRAMEMMEVVGATSTVASFNPNLKQNTLFNPIPPINPGAPLPSVLNTGNNFLFFKLRKPVATREAFYDQYLQGAFGDKSINNGYLYFKFLLKVNSANKSENKYEYVPGYAQIKDYGIVNQASTTYGYVELKEVPIMDFKLPVKLNIPDDPRKTNPIAKTGWQFVRLYLPKIAYDESKVPQNSSDLDIIGALASMGTQMVQFVTGFNNFMLINKYSQEFVPNKSWLRFCNPEQDKIAGGARVKSIRISDNWAAMDQTNGTSFEYGQRYEYTTVENGKTISSGVAAYEPMVGGDENPFRQPQVFTDRAILAPSNEFYQEEPFGESFFPSPQIVYSKVKVSNLAHPNVKRTATGSVVHEFYTARDFPTKTDDTGVRSIPKKTAPVIRQLLLKHKDYMTASEGFSIELNDMHGKPKAQWVYDEGGTRLSGVEYKYKRQGDRLVNENITVIDPSGVISNQAIVGLESSLVTDSREFYSKTRTAGIQLNTDNFLVGMFPALTVIPLPSYHAEETIFHSMVATKVVQRYGILEKTIAYDLGASVSTENVAWDAETGEVMLTQTFNEFHDPIYNFNIPAHWAYDGMRGAYQNLGARFSGVSISNGSYIATGGLSFFFTPGDEIIMTAPGGNSGPQKIWVKDVDRTSGRVYLINANGSWVALNATLNNVDLKIIRSGRRNQQLTSIGSITSLTKPFNAAQNKVDFKNKEILNASATEYSDRWQTWCSTDSTDEENVCANSPRKIVNPYLTNNRGAFRPLRTWTFLTDRKQTTTGANIRTDGPFTTFSPFWELPPVPINAPKDRDRGYWLPNTTNWTWASEVTRYNPVGNELENRDPLNRYSAELVGYANTQVVATAKNARYRQIAFDGFEDYFFSSNVSPCLPRHLQFNPQFVKKDASHSGNYAMKLVAGGSTSASCVISLPNCPAPLAAKPASLPFVLDVCDCVGVFSPDPGNYVLSLWVRENRDAKALNFNQSEVIISISGTPKAFKAEGPIIEGWQRIFGEFTVPTGATDITVQLKAASDAITWFDDIRIHPFKSSFKAFVYDDVNLRFTYELDENNFFTKYEYDQQTGSLERVKKETERGIMTIQESRFGQKKQ